MNRLLNTVFSRRRLAGLAALGLAAFGLAGAAYAAQTVTIGTEGVYAPFTYRDAKGQLTGYDVEVAREAAKRAGIDIKFVEAPWDALIAGLDAKRFDVVFNQVGPNPEREAKYLFSSSYLVDQGVVVVRKGNDKIKTLADVKGLRAAQSLTSNWHDSAVAAGATIVPVKDSASAFALVATRRADVTFNARSAVADFLKAQPNAPVAIAFATNDRLPVAALFRKTDKDLAERFTKAIDAMKADGTLDALAQRFLGVSAH